MTPNERQARRAAWLLVLNSLPRRHQNLFFEDLRGMVKKYLGNNPDRESESRLLSSQIVMRLIGAGSPIEESPTYPPDLLGASDDDRVRWLLQDVSRGLIPLIQEDIRREQFGRVPGGGYRTVQAAALRHDISANDSESDDATLERLQYEHDPQSGERAELSYELQTARILQGIRACIHAKFGAGSDEGCLIEVLANTTDLQDEFDLYKDHQWPIAKIAACLGERFSTGPWTIDRIDNARRNIRRWIDRLKTARGLTASELQALFAAVAKKLASPASLSSTRADQGSSPLRRPHQ